MDIILSFLFQVEIGRLASSLVGENPGQASINRKYDERYPKNLRKERHLNRSHLSIKEKSRLSKSSVDVKTTRKVHNISGIPTDKILSHVQHHRDEIISHLKMSLDFTGKTGRIKNLYNVPGYNRNIEARKNQLETHATKLTIPTGVNDLILDAANKIKLNTFLRNDTFFNKQQLGPYLPEKPIEILTNQKIEQSSFKDKDNKVSYTNKNNVLPKSCTSYKYNDCGVVSSAGSLLHSGLGKKIDSNDFVIRFNNAPSKGYEKDVGTKTSLRIVNSQVVGKPEFGFLDDRNAEDLYTKTPILVWDPSNYNATLEEWYSFPDFPFFETYFKKRLMRPNSEVHLLDPRSLWSIWDWLQSIHEHSILMPNPPSSGFLGVILAVFHCARVHVYEFVPSMRLTKRCHYYDEQQNIGCTIGDWHPLAAEKLAALKMNIGNDTEVYYDGYLTIPGVLGLKNESCVKV